MARTQASMQVACSATPLHFLRWEHPHPCNGAAQSWRWQAPKRARTQASAAPSLGRPGVVKDDKKTVYVKNLPYAAEEADLAAHFEQAGPVVDVRRGAAPDGAPARRTLG